MAATTAAADAAAARAAALQKLSSAPRSAKKTVKKKLMLKLYLEGLKTKLKAKGREPVKEAPAATPRAQHSQEELTIRGDGTRDSARACADVLRRHGCACLQTSLDSAKVERCRVLCEEALENTLKEADARGLDRTGLKTQEIVARQALRFDLVRGIADTEPFSALAKGGPWCAAIRQALGVDMKLIKSGCVVAMPAVRASPSRRKTLFDKETIYRRTALRSSCL